MRGPLGDRAAVEDMIKYAGLVREHAPSREALADQLDLHGVLWELAIIGEAANRTSPELRDRHPEVPWTDIIKMRNILVHAYDRIDVDKVWDAVEMVESLEAALHPIRDELPEL